MLRIFPFLVLGFALAAPSALAQEPATSFTLETYTTSYGGYFTFEGQSEQNPRLVVPPNTEITITLIGRDEGVHNIQVAGQPASEFVQNPGDTVTYTFTSPESGTVEYWCVPHRAMGMVGDLEVQTSGTDGGEQPSEGTPATPTTGGTPTNGATPTNGGTPATGGGDESSSGDNGTPGPGALTAVLTLVAAALYVQRRR